MPRKVLAISSQVARGHVGLSAALPALQALGHEVWPLPTILLSNHPGHAHVAGVRTPVDRLDAMLDALAANGWLGEVDAVATGYLPSAEHVAFAARAVGRVRALRRAARVLVDPVLGDEPKGLYIDAAAAAGIRDTLLPLATVATPNRFELGWLTGRVLHDQGDVEAAARALGVSAVVVTSAGSEVSASGAGMLDNLLVAAETCIHHPVAARRAVPHGTGDLLAGLLLAHLLRGDPLEAAFARTVEDVDAVVTASTGRDELALVESLPGIARARMGL